MKVNRHQLCHLLRTTCSYPDASFPEDPWEYLRDIEAAGYVSLPCDVVDVFWIPDRIPIFGDILRSSQSSVLLRQLFDRSADTGLVVDALLSGKNSLHLIHLAQSDDDVLRWVRGTNPRHVSLTIKTVDETRLLVATLYSFVFEAES